MRRSLPTPPSAPALPGARAAGPFEPPLSPGSALARIRPDERFSSLPNPETASESSRRPVSSAPAFRSLRWKSTVLSSDPLPAAPRCTSPWCSGNGSRLHPVAAGKSDCPYTSAVRAHLRHQSALPLHFKLQLLRIQRDQRLPFLDGIAHVRQHVGHPPIHLRTQRALFQRKQRAHRLNAPSRRLFRHRIKMYRRGVGRVPEDAAALRFRAPGLQNGSQPREYCETLHASSKHSFSNDFVTHRCPAAPVCSF